MRWPTSSWATVSPRTLSVYHKSFWRRLSANRSHPCSQACSRIWCRALTSFSTPTTPRLQVRAPCPVWEAWAEWAGCRRWAEECHQWACHLWEARSPKPQPVNQEQVWEEWEQVVECLLWAAGCHQWEVVELRAVTHSPIFHLVWSHREWKVWLARWCKILIWCDRCSKWWVVEVCQGCLEVPLLRLLLSQCLDKWPLSALLHSYSQ